MYSFRIRTLGSSTMCEYRQLFHISSSTVAALAAAASCMGTTSSPRVSVNSAFLITCLISCMRKRVRNLIELNEVRDVFGVPSIILCLSVYHDIVSVCCFASKCLAPTQRRRPRRHSFDSGEVERRFQDGLAWHSFGDCVADSMAIKRGYPHAQVRPRRIYSVCVRRTMCPLPIWHPNEMGCVR